MESLFSSLKTERAGRKSYRTRNEARADVFDYIERFYTANRRHSTIGYLSPVEFERRSPACAGDSCGLLGLAHQLPDDGHA
jgi:putative transposase